MTNHTPTDTMVWAAIAIVAAGPFLAIIVLWPILVIGLSVKLLGNGDPAGLIGVIVAIVSIVVMVVKRHNLAIIKRSKAGEK